MNLRTLILCILYAITAIGVTAQPVNNGFEDAMPLNAGSEKAVPLDTFSPIVDVTNATRTLTEWFPEDYIKLGLDGKSVWFKFTLFNSRHIELEIIQYDSGFFSNQVGMLVFKESPHSPAQQDLSSHFPYLNALGKVGNTCLPAGDYYVKICLDQQATGNIALNLRINTPQGPAYDTLAGAYPFALNSSFNIETTCLSAEAGDSFPDDGIEYKTAWITIKSLVNVIKWNLQMHFDPTDTIRYRLMYYDSAGQLIFKSVPGIVTNTKNFIYLDCTDPKASSAMIQLIIPATYFNILHFGSNGNAVIPGANHIPLGLPSKAIIGNVNQETKHGGTDSWNCNNIIKDLPGGCSLYTKGAVMDTFGTVVYSPSLNKTVDTVVIDTFEMQSWYTFTTSSQGNVELFIKQLSLPMQFLALRLFKGDIQAGCSPEKVAARHVGSNWHFCLEPGTYSVQLLGRYVKDTISRNDLGDRVNIDVIHTNNSSKNYYTPEEPHIISNILEPDRVYKSSVAWFESKDTTYTIAGETLRGSFQFRQFQLLTALRIIIDPSGNSSRKFRIYEGACTDGLNTLVPLDSTLFTAGWLNAITDFTGRKPCNLLNAGWYTLVLMEEETTYDCKKIYLGRSASFSAHLPDAAPHSSQFYQSPHKINTTGHLQPGVTVYSDDARINIMTYNTQYNVGCRDLFYSDYPVFSCIPSGKELELTPVFYSFYTTETLEVTFESNYTENGVLLQGDLSKDSTILFQPGKVIPMCLGQVTYCNLPPGEYTYVKWVNPAYSVYFKMRVDKPQHYGYDYFSGARNLGEFVSNGNITSSAVFNCAFSGNTTDPPGYYVNPDVSSFGDIDIISGDKTGNHWYTFTVNGPAEIKLDQLAKYGPCTEGSYLFLYEVKGAGNMTFTQFLASGLADSTNAGLLNLGGARRSLTFKKTDCGVKRYMVIVYRNCASQNEYVDMYKMGLTVTYTPTTLRVLTSTCTPAPEMQINGNSVVTEDFSLSCLENFQVATRPHLSCLDNFIERKGAWLKLNITNATKFDLEVGIRAVPNTSSGLTFQLFYGGCGAMTPGGCVSGAGQIIRYDCLMPGVYYLFVTSDVYFQSDIRITCTLVSNPDRVCLPFNPLFVKAHFDADGGCDNDSIKFQNYSTFGDDMAFRWFANGVFFSDEQSPSFLFPQTGGVDTAEIMLEVTNTVTGKTAFFTKKIFIGRPHFEIVGKSFADCGEKVYLKVKTTMPNSYEVRWSPTFVYFNPAFGDSTSVIINSEVNIMATLKAGNCTLTDELLIKPAPFTVPLTDTLVCNTEPVTFRIHPGDYTVWWNNIIVDSDTFVAAQPGTYWYTLRRNGCVYTDTVRMTRASRSGVYLPDDSIICLQPPVWLAPPKGLTGFEWQGNLDSIFLYENAMVKWSWSVASCLIADSMQVTFPPYHPSDTTVCPSDTGYFSGNPEWSYLWHDQQTYSQRYFTDPAAYSYTFSKGDCSLEGEYVLENYPVETGFLKTPFIDCSEPIIIDGGNALEYRWMPSGETGRYLIVDSPQWIYLYRINTNGCPESDSVEIKEDCTPILFIPNAFTPNQDPHNFTWRLQGSNVDHIDVRIYDRWGELLYTQSGPIVEWDGIYKGVPCMDGVYVYIVSYYGMYNGKKITGRQNGTITLLR